MYRPTHRVGDQGAVALASALQDNDGLRTVYLGCNGITAVGGREFAAVLANPAKTSLTSLWLKRNDLGLDGAMLLADALRVNASLTTLDLVQNGLGAEGAAAIVSAMAANPDCALENLYLSGNELGVEGAAAVGQALPTLASLRRLYLGSNRFGDDGVVALVGGLVPSNHSGGGGGGGDGGGDGGDHDRDAHEVTSASPTFGLFELGLQSSGITSRGAKCLGAFVAAHGTLERLDLGMAASHSVLKCQANAVGNRGLGHLLDGICAGDPRRSFFLNVMNNQISAKAGRRVAQALRANDLLAVAAAGNGLSQATLRRLRDRNAEVVGNAVSRSADARLDVVDIRSTFRADGEGAVEGGARKCHLPIQRRRVHEEAE